jgi:pyruvate dehydrogenase (quinone)
VAKALNGRAVLPDDLPFVTGSIGLLGTKPSADMMEGCDTLLMVGTSFPYSEWLPEPGQARGVQIDIDAGRLGIRYPMEVPMAGDAAATLRALVPLLERKQERAWRREIEEGIERWWRLLAERAKVEAEPINPAARLPRALRAAARRGHRASPTRARPTNWFARHLRLRSGMDAALSGTLGHRCARPCRMRWRPSWRFPRPPGHRVPRATGRCRCSASTP